MNALFWNVRGLNRPAIPKEIRDKIITLALSFVCILECNFSLKNYILLAVRFFLLIGGVFQM